MSSSGGGADPCPEDSTIPVELYKFSYQGNFLYYTSGAETQNWMGGTYLPYPIKRTHIASQAASIDQTLEVTAFRDFPPAQLFRVQAPSAIVNLTVLRKCQPDWDNQFASIWIGKALNAAWITNNEVKLQCESDLSSMRRLSLRRRYQLGCSYALYGRGCNLVASAFQLSASVFTVSGRAVYIPSMAGYADNYFAGGYLSYVSPLSGITETFAIRSSATGVMQLPLTPYGLSTATAVAVFPGCNHTTTVCKNIFNNLPNYGGQPLIPNVNPFAAVALF